MIVEPLSALMKTYQILKYAFTKCYRVFLPKNENQIVTNPMWVFVVSKRGQGWVILDPTLPHSIGKTGHPSCPIKPFQNW